MGETLRGKPRFVTGLAVGLLMATLSAVPAAASAGLLPADGICDFDGDGFEDLAIGVPGEDGPGRTDAGAVQVIFGSSNGLLAKRDQLWTQDSQGVTDLREGDLPEDPFDLGDLFGASTACGDHDGDGYSDLAVGIPGEDVVNGRGASVVDAGAVAVFNGSPTGLIAAGNQFLHQGLAWVAGIPLAGDEFGGAVAMDDFDGDGYDDLAVGIEGEDATVGATDPGKVFAGGIQIFSGGPTGFTKDDRLFTQDSPGFVEAAEFGDGFGAALATGDFDGDGYADLAVGTPDEAFGGKQGAGKVIVIFGSAVGLRARGQQQWHLGSPGIQGGVAEGDQFGFSVAAGDIDGDGFHDLLVGIPGKSVNRRPAAGMASVIFGGPGGLTSRDALLHQNVAGIKGVAEEGDRFGWAVTMGDFDGDGDCDVAIAAPDDGDGIYAAGAVNVIYYASGVPAHNDRWRQGLAGVKAEPAALDGFGETIRAGDFDGDGFMDLAIGIPEDDIGAAVDAGAVSILYGRDGGISGLKDRLMTQDSPGIRNQAEAGDFFGFVGPLRRTIGSGTQQTADVPSSRMRP